MQITINEDVTFLVSDERGDITEGDAAGLYHEDTRFLSRYALTLDGQAPLLLSARPSDYRSAMHFLTNPALLAAPRGTLSIVRARRLHQAASPQPSTVQSPDDPDDLAGAPGMREELRITNHGDHTATFLLELRFDADFADIFAVKQSVEVEPMRVRRVVPRAIWSDDGRCLELDSAEDGIARRLRIALSEPPQVSGQRCRFALRLAPRAAWRLAISFAAETMVPLAPQADGSQAPQGVGQVAAQAPAVARTRWPLRALVTRPARVDSQARHRSILQGAPTLETDSFVLQRAYEQSVSDFAALRIKGEDISGGTYTLAAGIPWFMALFGRDSLIAAYQALPFYPEAAKGVLRALARLQGTRYDRERAEEPGKILHEYRYGALADEQQVFPFPYYGTIDATPLFLMLLAAVYRVTGDLTFAHELREPAIRALDWLTRSGDRDGDGYLEYQRDGQKGLDNQGWKDSGDAIRFQDGRLASAPIALCEAQGYAYAARIGMAEVFGALGDHVRALRLRGEAATLKARFNRDYWLRDREYYALALDGEKRPVDALASNAGHLLWTGIADEQKAALVAERLLSPELFSGWGIRTMGTDEGGYNPISYHCGSVWPHDTSLIVAGLARYGHTEAAAKVAGGQLAALGYAPDSRLPELLAGYSQAEAPFPVEYPTANRPQAWASGSVFLLLAAMAGLDANSPNGRGAAFLPPAVGSITLDGIWADQRRTRITVTRRGKAAVARVAPPPLLARLGLG